MYKPWDEEANPGLRFCELLYREYGDPSTCQEPHRDLGPQVSKLASLLIHTEATWKEKEEMIKQIKI